MNRIMIMVKSLNGGKFVFPERMLLHYLMINIGYNEQKAYFIILYWSKKKHTITFKII